MTDVRNVIDDKSEIDVWAGVSVADHDGVVDHLEDPGISEPTEKVTVKSLPMDDSVSLGSSAIVNCEEGKGH